jgi:hypothetical protein
MTDSQYSIDCITRWVYGWIKNGWLTKNNTPVLNREFIEILHQYYEKYDIVLEHVNAHTNLSDDQSVANAKADELATRATQKATLEINSKSKTTVKSKTTKKPKTTGKSKTTKSKTTKSKTTKSKKPNKKIQKPKKTSRKSTNLDAGFPVDTNFEIELVE